jgi:hypothetical protein
VVRCDTYIQDCDSHDLNSVIAVRITLIHQESSSLTALLFYPTWLLCLSPSSIIYALMLIGSRYLPPMSLQASLSFLVLSGGAAASALVAYAYLTYRRNLRAVGGTPGVRTCIAMTRALMVAFPSVRIPCTDWYFSTARELWLNKSHACQSFKFMLD